MSLFLPLVAILIGAFGPVGFIGGAVVVAIAFALGNEERKEKEKQYEARRSMVIKLSKPRMSGNRIKDWV